MKKFLFLIISAVLVVSCDLTKMPDGSISTENALTSVDDVLKFRADIYLSLRDGLCSEYPIYIPELMTDSFHASITFGNRNGEYYKWEITSIFGYVESLWQRSYYNVTLANFLEQGIAELLANNPDMTGSEKSQLDVVLGEAAFLKAYSMYFASQLYCGNYNAADAANTMGLMLLDGPVENPSDIAAYVGRSSLEETYDYIEKYIGIAEEKLAAVGPQVGSIYLTSDAVKALKARVALTKGDYSTAIAASTSLVDSGTYPLIDNEVDFDRLWTNDSGEECIVQFWAGFSEGSLPGSNDYDYIGYNSSGIYSPNYIPEKWIVDAYDANDIRFSTWFKEREVTFGSIAGNVYLFYKFPGNPELRSPEANSNYINKIKPFRIAEQYLIAAEAFAMRGSGDDETNACKYLNALRSKRIPGYAETTYSGDKLVEEIREERVKELFGEGFRFADLKRWNKGFSRSEAQDDQIISNAGGTNTEFLSIAADSYQWLWPIPQSEIDANPQIRDEQNPGY